MFKKKIIILGFIVFVFSIINFSNAQETWDKKITKEAISTSTMWMQMERLNKIQLVFCNDWIETNKLTRILKIESRPWEKKDICIWVWNLGTQEVDVILSFSKAIKDKNDLRICQDDTTSWNDFSNMIYSKNFNNIYNIEKSLKPWESKIERAKILIPQNASWIIIWCVSHKIKGDVSRWSWAIFDVIVRKSSPIKITITWSVYKHQRLQDLKKDTINNKDTVFKIITGIIIFRLIISIIQHISWTKKRKHHKK